MPLFLMCNSACKGCLKTANNCRNCRKNYFLTPSCDTCVNNFFTYNGECEPG